MPGILRVENPVRKIFIMLLFLTFTYTTAEVASGLEDLTISSNSSWTEGIYEYDNVTIDQGAVLSIAGGSTLNVTGKLHLKGNSTVLLQGKNTSGQVNGTWQGVGVTINAANIEVEAGSKISADGQGYVGNNCSGPGAGPGGGPLHCNNGGNGGSYGGKGSGQSIGSMTIYGSQFAPTELGSGGSGGFQGGYGGAGGGAIRLVVSDTLTNKGTISADGGAAGYSGGGSGGSIYATVGTLAGSGIFTANGGSSSFPGGGGRVIVYYETNGSFSGSVGSKADKGTGESIAENGSIAFIDTSVPGGHLHLYHDLNIAGPVKYGSVTLDDASVLTLTGGTILTVNDMLRVTGNSNIIAQGKNTSGQVNGTWQGVGVTINAANVEVEAGSKITADGQGYIGNNCSGPGAGPGGGPLHCNNGGNGGSYGGKGGGPSAASMTTYGSESTPTDLGSGGSGGFQTGYGGAGGGAIRLIVSGILTNNGEISANGGGAWSYSGAGAGGSIYATVGTLAGNGIFTANGGSSDAAGSGGRIAVYSVSHGGFSGTGSLTAGGGAGSIPGQSGSVVFSDSPSFLWLKPENALFHDSEFLEWTAHAVDMTSHTADIVASNGLQSYALVTNSPIISGMDWDTRSVPDGAYELRLIFRNSGGVIIKEVNRGIVVNNSAMWHSGVFQNNQTWSANKVHVIEGDLFIPSGISLTIQPGTVVKVLDGAKIWVQDGGTLTAFGTDLEPIFFTSIADDSVGGDTNLDGNNSKPLPGAWRGIGVQGNGRVEMNNNTGVRFVRSTSSGVLTSSETWFSTYVYHVTGDITIPSGVTLTIQPGTGVKFDRFKGISVQPGGQLIANGTLALPIYFTSINDDSIGGDTNADGDSTYPAAGDWRWIYVDGANAAFDHVRILYGGGTSSGNWDGTGVIRTNGNSSLSISNSTVKESFFDGILAWGGPVTITNSLFTGIDRAISAHPGSEVSVINCTIDDNRIGLLVHGGTLNLANSIVTNSIESGLQYDFGTVGNVRYNDIYSVIQGSLNYRNTTDLTGLNGNISADPKYKNAQQENYRLSYLSPAIDAADGSVAPVTDFMGAPRYDDPRTVNTGIPAQDGAFADMGSFEFVETASSAVDLIVASIDGPSSVTAGDFAKVNWTVRNIGTGWAIGPWHDEVSLVPADGNGNVVKAGSILSGEGIVLGPGESYTVSGIVAVPGAAEGVYRWQIQANSYGEVFEGAQWNNNIAASLAETILKVNNLVIGGTAVSGRFTAPAVPHWFTLDVIANQDVVLSLHSSDPGSGLELYVGRGYMPDPTRYDSKSLEFNSSSASIILGNSSGGTYYVVAYPRVLTTTPANFTIQANPLAFGISSVSPITFGNAGPATLMVKGGQLKRDMTYEIVNTAGQAIAARSIYIDEPGVVYATFDVGQLAPGKYGIQVRSGQCLKSVLPDAVQIVSGTGGRLRASLVLPSAVRAGRTFNVVVEYGNEGDGDLESPVLYVTSARTPLAYKNYKPVPAGVPIQLIGISGSGPAGILRPGETGSIALTAVAAEGEMNFDLRSLVADSTAVDWNVLQESMRPDTVSVDAWLAGFSRLAANIGTTWADYQRALSESATRLGEGGWRTPMVSEAIKKELVRTSGSVLRGILLDQATGAPLPGMRLFVSTIDRMQAGAAVTDAQGRFSFENLSPGDYIVDSPDSDFDTLSTYTVTGDSQTDLVLRTAVTSFCGSVQSSLSLSGKTISGINTHTAEVFSAVINENGSFRFKKVSPGTYTLRMPDAVIKQVTHNPLQIAKGQTISNLTLTIDSGSTVSGIVSDAATGKIVSDALIYLLSNKSVAYTGKTDSGGGFSVTGITAGTYAVAAIADGYGMFRQANVSVGNGTSIIDILLPKPAVLSGAVTYNGQPDSTVFIRAELQDGLGLGLFFVRTDDSGRFSFEGLASGTYTLIAFAAGGSQQIGTVSISGGQHKDVGSLIITGLSGPNQNSNTPAAHGRGSAGYGKAGEIVNWSYLNPTPVPPGSWVHECSAGWMSPGHPQHFLPDVLVLNMLSTAQVYCNDTWLPFAAAKFGYATAYLWTLYLTTTQENPAPLQVFGDGSEIVEGSGSVAGFRNSATTRGTMDAIYTQAAGAAAQLFGTPEQPKCDEIKEIEDKEIRVPLEELVKNKTLVCAPATNSDAWSFGNPWDIPGNIAGGVGESDLYPDDRHVTGNVVVRKTGPTQITISFEDVIVTVLDSIDFLPGDLSSGYEVIMTGPMAFLESYNWAYDVTFQARWHEEPYSEIREVPALKGPKCPPPPPPPPPVIPDTNPNDSKKTVGKGSIDPNAKGTIGYGDEGYFKGVENLYFTVEFENQPSATAPAQKVVVTDQLSENLDWSTFELVSIGFNNTQMEVPEGLQIYTGQITVTTDPYPVRVSAGLDPSSGVITWLMESTDPVTGDFPEDPDAGFLPPNDSTHRGEGHLVFRIRPKPGLANGTAIPNLAVIVFDENAPISTNLVVNTIDKLPPKSSVKPLPAFSETSFGVYWAGDDSDGSGIALYDVYVSENGGAFKPWLTGTSQSSGAFEGVSGRIYGFYSIAKDNVGNMEDVPSAAQATTTTKGSSYSIAIGISPAGAGTVSAAGVSCPGDCVETYTPGTVVTLTATAGSGFILSGWTGCDSVNRGQCIITMNSNKTVSAVFSAITSYALNISITPSGGGTVSAPGIYCLGDCSELFSAGTNVMLSPSPAQGYRFTGWNGCDSVSGNGCFVTMDRDRSVSASFSVDAGVPQQKIPLPSAENVYRYAPVAHPVVNLSPEQMKPIGSGTAAEGGEDLDVTVQLGSFEAPADIFLGLYAPALDTDNLYLFAPDGSVRKLLFGPDKSVRNLADAADPWRNGASTEINESVLDTISISSLPNGKYFLFLLATPAGDVSRYYLWLTDVDIPTFMPLPKAQLTFPNQISADPIRSSEPGSANPIGIGALAHGGNSFSLKLSTGYFKEPVDVYFAVESPIFGNELMMLGPDYSLNPPFVKFSDGMIGRLDMRLIDSMPPGALTPGSHTLWLGITPHGVMERFYLWKTRFEVP